MVIPAGPLREKLSAIKRAECVVINGNKNIHIEKTILNINEKIKIFYCKYMALNIDSFKNKNVVAFAGIGNPDNFFDLLESNIPIFKMKQIFKKALDQFTKTNKELSLY